MYDNPKNSKTQNLTLMQDMVIFKSFDVMDYNSSRAASQNFMKELGQSDLLFLSYDSGCITTPKN